MPQSSGLDQSAVSPHVLNQQLNQEIEDLYLEVEELHRETALLTGLMAGSYAYFLQKLMLGHQGQAGLSAEECEQIVVDALKRIQSSQKRFELNFLAEIETVLQKMSQPLPLEPYLQQMNQ
jgi:hypothetical protein